MTVPYENAQPVRIVHGKGRPAVIDRAATGITTASDTLIHPLLLFGAQDGATNHMTPTKVGILCTTTALYRWQLMFDPNVLGPALALANPSDNADDIIDFTPDHDMVAGDIVVFTALTGGAGLTTYTPYYVLAANLAAKTMQVSLTRDGAEALFSTDITAGTARKVLHAASDEDLLTTGIALANPSAATDDIIDTTPDHGLVAGDRVRFTALTGGTLLLTSLDYYVIAANLAAKTFQVSLTEGGAAINFTTDITAGTVRKYVHDLLTWTNATSDASRVSQAKYINGLDSTYEVYGGHLLDSGYANDTNQSSLGGGGGLDLAAGEVHIEEGEIVVLAVQNMTAAVETYFGSLGYTEEG